MIGNPSTFGIDLIPVAPSWQTRYAPESGAWAGVAIWVGGVNLSRHLVDGTDEVREYLFVPTAPLADWLVSSFSAIAFEERAIFHGGYSLHEKVRSWATSAIPGGLDEDHWLDLREAWWKRHFMRAGSEGARIPNIAFGRDDTDLVLEWDTPRFGRERSIAMLDPAGSYRIDWETGVDVLEEFVTTVGGWVCEAGLAAEFTWALDESPLRGHLGPFETRLSLFTARSIDDLKLLFGTDTFASLLDCLNLQAGSEDPAASPECQVLRDLGPTRDPGVGSLLRNLGEHTRDQRPASLARMHDLRSIAAEAARGAATPEEAGQAAAFEVRHHFGLNGGPINDHSELLEGAGIRQLDQTVASYLDRMAVAARSDGSAWYALTENPWSQAPWAQRFEACRALGHVLLDPFRESAIGAASGAFSQGARRRRSGAFAAELLLPESALARLSDGRLDGAADPDAFSNILHEYGVGATTAAHQLLNRGWLSSRDVRDELIEHFAAPDA